MREIKFRCKDKNTNKWVYFDLELLWKNGFKCGEENYGCHNENDTWDNLWLIKETIGQYIGLKDKNGKEIYEGDIVEINKWKKHVFKGIVIFEIAKFIMKDIANYNLRHAFWGYGSLEIIGNIYENPELMERE